VNAVISKRFAKRQQMQWTKRGAHLLLQTRTRTLDGTLRSLFEEWYPGLANENAADAAQPEEHKNPRDPDALLRRRSLFAVAEPARDRRADL
jgi:hypothetical protein